MEKTHYTSLPHPIPSPILQSLRNLSATEQNTEHCTTLTHPVPSPILQSLQNLLAAEQNTKHCTNLTHPEPSPLFGACETFQQLNEKTHKCGNLFAIRLTHFSKTKQWPPARHHCMIKQHNIGNNNTMHISFVRESSSIIKWASFHSGVKQTICPTLSPPPHEQGTFYLARKTTFQASSLQSLWF
jgi:hypothetical protein